MLVCLVFVKKFSKWCMKFNRIHSSLAAPPASTWLLPWDIPSPIFWGFSLSSHPSRFTPSITWQILRPGIQFQVGNHVHLELCGIHTLLRETPESTCAIFLPCEDTRSQRSATHKRALSRHHALDLPASRPVRSKCLLFKPASLWHSATQSELRPVLYRNVLCRHKYNRAVKFIAKPWESLWK